MPESRRDRDGERLTKEAWITLWKTKFPPPDHYATLDSPWIFELDGGEAAFMQTDADSAYEAYGIHCSFNESGMCNDDWAGWHKSKATAAAENPNTLMVSIQPPQQLRNPR